MSRVEKEREKRGPGWMGAGWFIRSTTVADVGLPSEEVEPLSPTRLNILRTPVDLIFNFFFSLYEDLAVVLSPS